MISCVDRVKFLAAADVGAFEPFTLVREEFTGIVVVFRDVDVPAFTAVRLLSLAFGVVVGVTGFGRTGAVTEFAGTRFAFKVSVLLTLRHPVTADFTVVTVGAFVFVEEFTSGAGEASAARLVIRSTSRGIVVLVSEIVEVGIGDPGKMTKGGVVKNEYGFPVRVWVLGELELLPGPRSLIDGISPLIDAVNTPFGVEHDKRRKV